MADSPMWRRRRVTTRWWTHKGPRWANAALAGGSVLIAGAIVALLISAANGPGARPEAFGDTAPPTSTTASPAPDESPTPEITAAQVYDGPLAKSPAQAVALARSFGVAPGRFGRAAVVLLDRQTGQFYGSGDVDGGYRTASLVKLFLAARMLVQRPSWDPDTQQLMWRLITCSDDAAATTLWARLGQAQTITWVIDRYGLTEGLSPPPAERPQSWGLTSVSARALATFYAKVVDDPAVAPWLLNAMANAAPKGCDQYYQHFGLPEAAVSWRVKQGWIHSWNGHAYLHTTGFVEHDRYIAVVLTEGPSSLYDGLGPGAGRWIVTGMAQALLPHGHVPGGSL